MKHLIVIIAAFSFLTGTCQSRQGGTEGMNKNLWSIIYQECEHPDIVDVEVSEDGFVEVECLCDGKLLEFGFKNNALMYTERTVEKRDIPFEKIKKKLEKDYGDWSLDDLSLIKTGDTAFFKVEVVKDGIEQNLYFTEEGKWYKFNSLSTTDKWDVHLLKENDGNLFHLHTPEKIYELPDVLREVSGITLGENELMYCVQDELGAIFEYDLKSNRVSNLYRFTDIGDFEDISIFGKYAVVLRSDGLLFHYDLAKKKLEYTTMLPLNSMDVEGLCTYGSSLFVASKAPLINQSEIKRTIFQIDGTDLTKINTYLEIDVEEIAQLAKSRYADLKIGKLEFNPSALAFHPLSGELYVLSASDRILTVFENKNLKNVILLPADVYYKPEGIAFSNEGLLFISNEGDKKGFSKPTILQIGKTE